MSHLVRQSAAVLSRVPAKVRLRKANKALNLEYTDGTLHSLPFELLRVTTPSVQGQGRLICNRRHVSIIDVELVGNYGMRFQFDDLHGTGIFSWDLLYEMGESKYTLMKQYIQRLQTAGKSRGSRRSTTSGVRKQVIQSTSDRTAH
mmetsp:Transcript_6901/g.20994  ORF Transcript_6901/g.20994 Transcript_6901/m.20994 type:complete len:146 (-) Transcript_6901:46-483(-)|eukprot:CAMPEP_0198726116 /NCGR_PEP_ID=MMETSP1475-20131203/3278_1 /TAXON_ID= ORGANISM="Unidentified sp., Strain CCMP1999" /NCGR_SAMPLE_ID=MMETSP1475 /ASSEMBLY_ACC=CAM_ASM_001111 /LENGTH=145 /DNA_ID=CAMNT_0044488009 /DNA_START=123 /DNA_END=560 /DNA_ORIENTATION=+